MLNEYSSLLSRNDDDCRTQIVDIINDEEEAVDTSSSSSSLSSFITSNSIWNHDSRVDHPLKNIKQRRNQQETTKLSSFRLLSYRSFLLVGLMFVVVWCIMTTISIYSYVSSSIPSHEDYQMAMDHNGDDSSLSHRNYLMSLNNFFIALDIGKAQREANEAIEFLSSTSTTSTRTTSSDPNEQQQKLRSNSLLLSGNIFDLSHFVSSSSSSQEVNEKEGRNSSSDTNDETDDDVDYPAEFQPIQHDDGEVDINNIPLLGKSHKDDDELQEGCEATVMIVRHCEKSVIREHCDYIGYERSVYLASQFGHHDIDRWPLPSYLFATNPAGRDNRNKLNLREIELLAPLADKAGVPIDDTYYQGDEGPLAKAILTNMKTGNLCGKLVIISWKHSLIGHLARKLGCGPENGCPMDYKGKDFDDAWQIKYVYRIPKHAQRKSLKLEKVPKWYLYGSIQHENFDPLRMSKQYGDYPSIDGTSYGGRWESKQISYPERKRKKGISEWHPTSVGFNG